MITAAQRQAWTQVPVDDVGYFDSAVLAALPEENLRELISRMEVTRYTGWRNYAGLWRDGARFESTRGARVLDYGTGTGLEALQYAKVGNTVALADIAESNLVLATRVLDLWGYRPVAAYLLDDEPPYAGIEASSLDVVHMSGVLHHIPDPVPVVGQVARWLRPGGELRLMLYSDVAWRMGTGTDPPADVTWHPARHQFVRFMDQTGEWADWYDAARLEARFGHLLRVGDVRYITHDSRYLTAILTREPS